MPLTWLASSPSEDQWAECSSWATARVTAGSAGFVWGTMERSVHDGEKNEMSSGGWRGRNHAEPGKLG